MSEAGHIIPPCPKCPYKQGKIKTLVNPCPRCKRDGYSTYDRFIAELSGVRQNERE